SYVNGYSLSNENLGAKHVQNPTKEKENWKMKVLLMALLIVLLIISFAIAAHAQKELWRELDRRFRMLYEEGQYTEAEHVGKKELTIAEKTFEPDHPNVAQSLNNLALLYQTQGRYDESEPLFKRALAIYEKAFGKNHPDVATTCDSMAGLYRQIGKEDEAENLEARARKIRSNL
ncbi:MAG: tetratricopeptide repeat protein, partial [Desulfobacteraceae bacterium]|nr:tetratricopeptide repeat protein [Desulfobacteraceae bacterium]